MTIDFDVNERYCARPESDIRKNRHFPRFNVNVTPLTASNSVLAGQSKGDLAIIVGAFCANREGGREVYNWKNVSKRTTRSVNQTQTRELF